MLLVLAGIAGLLAALFIHWLAWALRLRYPSAILLLGVVSGLGLTGFCLLFLNSDIVNMIMVVLAGLWVLALLLGGLQASALRIALWKGMAGVFFEMALAFVTGAALNLTLQRYIPWLAQRFPGIDVYAVLNAFLWGLAIPLLVLAVLRPLLRLTTARAARSKPRSRVEQIDCIDPVRFVL